ncbi:hypothetical protein H8959_000418 [Pygathrix nigripes]
MPEKPAEEGNDSKEVPGASGPQNDGKQLCPPGKPGTSKKINKRSGKRKQFGNNPSGFPGYVQVSDSQPQNEKLDKEGPWALGRAEASTVLEKTEPNTLHPTQLSSSNSSAS